MAMLLIRDDPIVRSLERSGLPPWAVPTDRRGRHPEEDDDGEDQEALLD